MRVDLCSPDLRALLGLPETLPSTTIEDRFSGRAEDWQIAIAADKYRILTPVLLTQPGSPERANAIRELAAQPMHQVRGNWLQPADAEVLAAGGIPEIVSNALVAIDPDQAFDVRLQWAASYIVGRLDPLVVAIMDYFEVGDEDLDRIFGVTPYEVTP